MRKRLARLFVACLILRGLTLGAQTGLTLLGVGGKSAGGACGTCLLLENGSFILQEDGTSKLLQE